MAGETVLVCGAGVAGSVLAFWLARFDFNVTVIERSRVSQKAGQGIEIEEPALQVVEAMGIMDDLRSIRTGEEGFNLENERGDVLASAGLDGPVTPTGALEMMRGDLVEVLYKAANRSDKVKYEFQTKIADLELSGKQVIVQLEHTEDKTTRTETYDFVIGADGIKSKTRGLAMGSDSALNCLKPIGAYVAYFSIPNEDRDWPNSRLCHFPGRRIVWIRPVRKQSDVSSVYFIHLAKYIPSLRSANTQNDRQGQKEAFAELYKGLGWETPRVVHAMLKSDNFYSDELAQVKLKTWSKGRVALVGDAAWAPTPFTGQGNQLAIIGGFVLAQEMSRSRNETSLTNYERRLRSYVEQCQGIPLNGYAPYILCPQTAIGIWTIRTVLWAVLSAVSLITRSGLSKYFPPQSEDHFDLEMDDIDRA